MHDAETKLLQRPREGATPSLTLTPPLQNEDVARTRSLVTLSEQRNDGAQCFRCDAIDQVANAPTDRPVQRLVVSEVGVKDPVWG